MGTEARIVLYATDSATAHVAATAAFARIRELDRSLSDYRDDSQVAGVAAAAGGPPVRVGEDLVVVLLNALALAEETDGAFDVTAGPLVALWREARRTGRLPDSSAIREALARVGWQHVQVDSTALTVRLGLPGMRLDLGGIGKGYAVDEALRTLYHLRVSRALVSLGGEIAVGRAPPGQQGWLIQIEHADAANRQLWLERAAVSSSGPAEQYVDIGGVRWSHVVDPRTGWALTTDVVATVVAPDGMRADAWATAVTVLDSTARRAFIARRPEGRFWRRVTETD